MHRVVTRLFVLAALAGVAVLVPTVDAGAQIIEPMVEIVKVVEGPGPDGAVYEIQLSCQESGDTTVNLMDGESDTVAFLPGEVCTVTETVTNGAESVSYACVDIMGVDCLSNQTFEVVPDSILGPEVRVTVTNTYPPEPTTTTTTTVPTTTTTVAPAVAVTPAFTG